MKKREPRLDPEAEALRASLIRHGQLREDVDPDAPLPSGVTHIIERGKLVQKRKSFF